ncbi:MAG: NAD(P)H-dependent oxidoreductase subunit E, partial [Calditrichaeota bacterium]
YPSKRAATLPILHSIQQEYGYIPEEAEPYVAELVEVPPVKIREVLLFYTLFHRQPIGKYHFQVCRTVSCWLRGAKDILAHLREKLDLEGEGTTPDQKYTLTEVECLGACELAPMMQLNEDYIGPLTPEKIDEILKNLESER